MRNIENNLEKINCSNLYDKFNKLPSGYKLVCFIPYTIAAIAILPIVLLTYVVRLIIKTIDVVILTPLIFVANYLSSTTKGKVDDIVIVTKEEKIESFSPNPNFTDENKAYWEIFLGRIKEATEALKLNPDDTDAKSRLDVNSKRFMLLPKMMESFDLQETSIKINDYYIHYVDTTGFDANTLVINSLPNFNFLTILFYALIRFLYNIFIVAITAVEFFVLDWSKFFNSHVTCRKLSSDLLIFGFILLNLILMNLPIGYAVLTSLVTTALFNNSSKHKLLLYSAASAVFAFYFLYSLEIISLFPYLLVAFITILAYSSLSNLHKNYTAINNKLFFTLSCNILLFAILGLASIAVPYFYAVSVFNIIGLSQPAVFMIINAICLLWIVFESIIYKPSEQQKYTPLKGDDTKTPTTDLDAPLDTERLEKVKKKGHKDDAKTPATDHVLAADLSPQDPLAAASLQKIEEAARKQALQKREEEAAKRQNFYTKQTPTEQETVNDTKAVAPPRTKTPNKRNETQKQQEAREARVAAIENYTNRARNQVPAQA